MFGLFRNKRSVLDSGLLHVMADRHSHILYGVDDGIGTLDESLETLSWLESQGLKELWCTPHIMEDMPNTTVELKERFSCLCAEYKGSIVLHLAAEYMLDNLFQERFAERDLLLMEDGQILVETSTWSPPYALEDTLAGIMRAGYRPVLAHPERYRYMDRKDYDSLHEMGVRFQVNLPSVAGGYGPEACAKAEYLLKRGYVSNLGSDCHSLSAVSRFYSRRVLSGKVAAMLESAVSGK